MRERIVRIAMALTGLVLLVAGFAIYSTISSVPQLFRRGAELKAQGYYMGEFEFKMVASQYYLNEGRYLDAYQTLRRITNEMATLRGLNKMPLKATPEEQMAFLLEQQDPVTGAFMDHRYPAFSYFAPTCNVVEALTKLSQEVGRPLKLKHPLRFLDQIKTSEQLRAYLDSLLFVGEMAAHFPGPGPYGPGVSEIAGFDTLEKAGIYRFSESWKTELRRWINETQDPATGFWGARIGNATKWRQKADINATFHVLKFVLAETGENQSSQYPLRYAGELAKGVLGMMSSAIPEGESEQHDWGLTQYQGAKMLTKYLWPHLSASEKDEVRSKFRVLLTQFNRLYRPDDGGFAYYTTLSKADVDGTGLAVGVLQVLGTMYGTWERERLWGEVSETDLLATRVNVENWSQATVLNAAELQSLRVYRDSLPSPRSYDDANLVRIVYPPGSSGLDIMDVRQGFAKYLSSDGTAFGNWKSKLSLKEAPLGLEREVKRIQVTHGSIDLAEIRREYPASGRFFVVGYDIVQLPVLVIEIVTGG